RVDLVSRAVAQLVADAEPGLYLVAESKFQERAVVTVRAVDCGAATQGDAGRTSAASGERLLEVVAIQQHAGIHRQAPADRDVVLDEERIRPPFTNLRRLRREVPGSQGRHAIYGEVDDLPPAIRQPI